MMTNYDKLKELFPEIPEHSGLDIWGDFWDEEFDEKTASETKEPRLSRRNE